MTMILVEYGSCESADSGTAGLKKFREALDAGEPFGLITLDISMPDMNGIEVLRRIKAEEDARKIAREQRVTIIMVTVSSDEESIVRCAEEGCDNYIMKPFNKLLVGKTIKRYLGDIED